MKSHCSRETADAVHPSKRPTQASDHRRDRDRHRPRDERVRYSEETRSRVEATPGKSRPRRARAPKEIEAVRSNRQARCAEASPQLIMIREIQTRAPTSIQHDVAGYLEEAIARRRPRADADCVAVRPIAWFIVNAAKLTLVRSR